MTNEEILNGYRKIIDDQTTIIKGYAELVNNYEQQLKKPQPSFTQGLLGNPEILVEHLKKNTGEPIEFDSLKLSDEERRKRFGARIKSLRKSLGLTQEKLGEMIGATKSTIALLEGGRREAGYRNLIGLARSLHTTTDFLIGAEPLP